MAGKPEPKLASEGEHFFERLPGQTDVEEWLAANPAPPLHGDNGRPETR